MTRISPIQGKAEVQTEPGASGLLLLSCSCHLGTAGCLALLPGEALIAGAVSLLQLPLLLLSRQPGKVFTFRKT